jgi:outer membrane protein
VIQPYNQLDANLGISIPLIDVSAWKRLAAANASVEVSQLNERVAQLEVETQVSRSYYQLLGQEAVLEAAKRALSVAHANLELVQTRAASGAASELELQRGRAEVARAEGDLAAAEFAVTTARRQLSTATWLDPEPATGFIEDDLHEEAPLATWMLRAGSTPRVRLAEISRQAAEKSLAASKAAWLPTLSASAQERFTNATGFAGHNAVYVLQASLSWRVDATVPANVRAQDAALATTALRRERAERGVQDTIYQAWHQVRASIERSRAARAQVSASRQAVELARDRYSVGAATQLDVIQAQQEAFRADVSRIQADTELAYARLALRTSTGTAIQGTQP